MLFKRKKNDTAGAQVAFLVRSQDVEGLTRLVENPRTAAETRQDALEGLIALDHPSAWDALGHMVASAPGDLVETVARQLEEMTTPAALAALGDCLSNPSPFARSAAINAIGRNPAPSTLPHLLRATRDPESSLARRASRIVLRRIERNPGLLSDLREATIEGILGLMDDRWSMELMSDRFPEKVRIIAAGRLGVLGGEEASQALASVAQVAQGAFAEACWAALENCTTISDFTMLPLLVDPRPEVKARALAIYARFSDATAADLIAGLANDGDPRVRIAALTALTSISGEGAIGTLEVALDDLADEVRECAIDLLCGLQDSTPELVRIVSTQDGEVRRRALVTLAARNVMTDPLVHPYIEFLYKGSACTDLSQRNYLDSLAMVAKTLGQSQNFEALLALTALARSVIRRLRRAAIEGLMCYPPEDRVDALFSLMDSHDADVVRNVGMGLHQVRDERALIPLIRTTLECRGKQAMRAKDALEDYEKARDIDFLISCLTEKWASVRRWAAEKMKSAADPKSIPALLVASRDEDVEVQLAVFEAMAPFASNSPEVIERMLEAVKLGDISVRQQACEALGEARCEEAVPELIRALHNFFLRPRASDAPEADRKPQGLPRHEAPRDPRAPLQEGQVPTHRRDQDQEGLIRPDDGRK
ncbi:MAG: HEAT repeat domain-containing protein [Planctomycetota bacterium]